jgi:hypothetical protein
MIYTVYTERPFRCSLAFCLMFLQDLAGWGSRLDGEHRAREGFINAPYESAILSVARGKRRPRPCVGSSRSRRRRGFRTERHGRCTDRLPYLMLSQGGSSRTSAMPSVRRAASVQRRDAEGGVGLSRTVALNRLRQALVTRSGAPPSDRLSWRAAPGCTRPGATRRAGSEAP